MHDQQSAAPDQDREDDPLALASKVAFLSRPNSYKPVPGTVIARETHMSWVFMAGDRVYKLKKPVRFPYLDFSTLARRAAACRAEVALNGRLAPDVYLGVAQLTLTSEGYAIGTSGRVADWLVVMRRLDETQTLEELLRARKVSPAQVQRLADNLHRFYSHASRSTTNAGCYVASLKQATALDRHVLLNRTFDLNRGTVERVFNIQRRFLRQRRKLLADRVRHRFILDGHGDLRPEHIWLNAPFPIIDCLEFNTRLRTLDALDELAFLHLECERLGGRWVGDALRRRLAVLLHDDPSTGLFLFYRISRAMLRARLAIAHMLDPKPRTPEKWPRLARTYLAIARADALKLERLLSNHA
jgi:aminoglycoside phosphotransferase family enzyme